MRLLRASVAQTVATPFAEFARMNGIRGPAYVRTIVANAAPPAVHAFTVMIAGLLGGGIVVETLFNVPGLGYELTRAVENRDVPLVQEQYAAGVPFVQLRIANGASASAVLGEQAVEASMGLTPLEGLVMGTRTGDIDPTIYLHHHQGGARRS